MCLTDIEHEVGHADYEHTIYPSIAALKKAKPCVRQCGIARVAVFIEEVAQAPDYTA